jgi:hypothetical protein
VDAYPRKKQDNNKEQKNPQSKKIKIKQKKV